MLEAWNKKINLTRITGLNNVIPYHFCDSLHVDGSIDFSTISGIADVGAGAGFPGLPLKIKYPHIFSVLIEVNHKKIQFLQAVIDELNLTNIEVYPYDWRTFLRTTDYPLDFVCARASLHMDELLRMFKPASSYKTAQLVYWASDAWQAGEHEKRYLIRSESYEVGNRKRKYAFFKVK